MAYTLGKVERDVRKWQKRLGYEHWEIIVKVDNEGHNDDDPEYEDRYFLIAKHQEHDRAILYVMPWVIGQAPVPDWVEDDISDDSFVERGIAHEIVHLIFHDLRIAAKTILEDNLSEPMQEMARKALNRYEEQAVDRVATNLVRSWPNSK